jgi:hypothetical protein
VPGVSATAPAPATAADAVSGLTRVTVLQALAGALIKFDANIDASVDTLIWRSQPIRKVRVTTTLQNRDLTLRELSVNDLGGAQGKLSGYFQGIGTAQPKTQFAFDMRGPELGRVLRLLSPTVASADTFGAFSLGGEIDRQVGRFSLDTDVEVGGGKLHVAGDSPSADTWSLTASLEHPSFNRLMRLVSARYRSKGGELGPVKFDGTVEWSSGGVAMRKFSAAIGDLSIDGNFQVALTARPLLTAKLTFNDLAIDKFMPARLTASLDEPAGQIRPGVMLAQAGSLSPRAAGEHWSRTPIELDFLNPLDADVSLVGKSLSWASWKVDDPQVKLGLKDSVLNVSRLSGRLFGGALAATRWRLRSRRVPHDRRREPPGSHLAPRRLSIAPRPRRSDRGRQCPRREPEARPGERSRGPRLLAEGGDQRLDALQQARGQFQAGRRRRSKRGSAPRR